ncbi:hypothetical protein CEXT_483121 [Caerostris extrusa]|uniref:Uncharacterized protein n=1 Tax=Caerostris extrusa TaxID=172846 RepID=A0AAV4UJQ1_CAEEX|nr:hypothetical protein CEXT_483121 [Caerostris extrusa]
MSKIEEVFFPLRSVYPEEQNGKCNVPTTLKCCPKGGGKKRVLVAESILRQRFCALIRYIPATRQKLGGERAQCGEIGFGTVALSGSVTEWMILAGYWALCIHK